MDLNVMPHNKKSRASAKNTFVFNITGSRRYVGGALSSSGEQHITSFIYNGLRLCAQQAMERNERETKKQPKKQ
jgi:hypothetical protein